MEPANRRHTEWIEIVRQRRDGFLGAVLLAALLVFGVSVALAQVYGVGRGTTAARGPNGGAAAKQTTVVKTPNGVAAKQTTAVKGPNTTVVKGSNTAVAGRTNVVAGGRVLPHGYLGALPGGYREVYVSGVRYYLAGGVYYRPEMYEGQTVYVVVQP